jgi:ribulose 1,5-bisphosphate carboxylase large subunit-like protein
MSQIDPSEVKVLLSSREEIDMEQYIVVSYRVSPRAKPPLSLEEAAIRICAITSLRTLGTLPYESQAVRLQNAGRVLSVQKDTGEISIAFPLHMCSVNEGLTQLFLILVFGVEYGYADEFLVTDIELPRSFAERFRGPKFGIEGIRQLFDIPLRPLIGVSIKPRVGIPLAKIAEVCRESLMGGADFIADDMALVDPDGELTFVRRVQALVKVAQDAGKKKQYFANISTSPFRALKLAEIAKNEGVGGVIVDAFTMGFPAVQELSHMVDLPFVTTNMGLGMLNRVDQTIGVASKVTSKISRMAGIDAIHAGTSSSECFGPEAWGPAILAFRSGFSHMKPCFAVAEGDLTISDVWDNIYSLGPDVMLEVCSGILNYPGGPYDGAQAFLTLVENLSHRMSHEEGHDKIMEIASRDAIVRQGLDSFGYQPTSEE